MNIDYCCLVSKADKILLAEFPIGGSNWMRIQNLLNKIYNGTSANQINIESDLLVNYFRTVPIIFICISRKSDFEGNEQIFLQKVINAMKNEYESLDKMMDNDILIKKFCFQEKVGIILKKLFVEFSDEIEKNKANDIIFNKNLFDSMKDPLVDQSFMGSTQADFTVNSYENQQSESRKCTKKTTVVLILTVVSLLLMAYIIVSMMRCSNLNIFCET